MKTEPRFRDGTGRQTLFDDYDLAEEKLRAFVGSFEAIEFNARDYYPQGEHAFLEAKEDRIVIEQKIHDIKKYLERHKEHIYHSDVK